jgi:hypothetical protein
MSEMRRAMPDDETCDILVARAEGIRDIELYGRRRGH